MKIVLDEEVEKELESVGVTGLSWQRNTPFSGASDVRAPRPARALVFFPTRGCSLYAPGQDPVTGHLRCLDYFLLILECSTKGYS